VLEPEQVAAVGDEAAAGAAKATDAVVSIMADMVADGIRSGDLVRAIAESGRMPQIVLAALGASPIMPTRAERAAREALRASMRADAKAVGMSAAEIDLNSAQAALGANLRAFQTRCNLSMARDAADGYREIVSDMILRVNRGELAPERAVAEGVRRMAERGVRVVTYRGGRREHPDVVMRRHIQTMTKQAATDGTMELCQRLGVRLVEVDSHKGARETHRAWQGRVYGVDGPVVMEDGTRYPGLRESGAWDGLHEPNCLHSMAPYVHGRAKRWSEDPDGGEERAAEGYKMRQRQRANERRIREAKREVAALEAQGEDATAARLKLGRAEAAQRRLLAQKGAPRRRPGREEAYDARGRRIEAEGIAADAARERDERVNGPLPNTVHKGRQAKHVKGTPQYSQEIERRKANGSRYPAPSWLSPDLTDDDIQALVDRYAGRGTPKVTRSGEWSKKEICRSNRMIGYNVGADGVQETDTFIIHYSKAGVHIVPMKPLEGEQ